MLSVRVAYHELVVDIDVETTGYSPDLVDDLAARCASTLLAVLARMWAVHAEIHAEIPE